ncbi:MAG: hypothetical protein JRI73_12710 [Deltaproteobacteria bacterium]|nr:hypothetical protein [Deltaproteobacteria bacterium]
MAKAKDKDKNDRGSCPVGRFFSDLEKASGNKAKFLEHLSRSKLEFLKAVKYLVDDKIENLEKKRPAKGKKRATKIRVE